MPGPRADGLEPVRPLGIGVMTEVSTLEVTNKSDRQGFKALPLSGAGVCRISNSESKDWETA